MGFEAVGGDTRREGKMGSYHYQRVEEKGSSASVEEDVGRPICSVSARRHDISDERCHSRCLSRRSIENR